MLTNRVKKKWLEQSDLLRCKGLGPTFLTARYFWSSARSSRPDLTILLLRGQSRKTNFQKTQHDPSHIRVRRLPPFVMVTVTVWQFQGLGRRRRFSVLARHWRRGKRPEPRGPGEATIMMPRIAGVQSAQSESESESLAPKLESPSLSGP